MQRTLVWHRFAGTRSVGQSLVGARTSLLIGIGGAIVPQIIGIFLGGISGYFGGWVDMLIMRIMISVSASHPWFM